MILHDRLRARLAAAGPADDVVLAPAEEEDACRRTITRLNGMWALGDPIERFRYDGGRA